VAFGSGQDAVSDEVGLGLLELLLELELVLGLLEL
jgi:hypothetical protein